MRRLILILIVGLVLVPKSTQGSSRQLCYSVDEVTQIISGLAGIGWASVAPGTIDVNGRAGIPGWPPPMPDYYTCWQQKATWRVQEVYTVVQGMVRADVVCSMVIEYDIVQPTPETRDRAFSDLFIMSEHESRSEATTALAKWLDALEDGLSEQLKVRRPGDEFRHETKIHGGVVVVQANISEASGFTYAHLSVRLESPRMLAESMVCREACSDELGCLLTPYLAPSQ